MIVLGIDPGLSGGLAVIDGDRVEAVPMPETCAEIRDTIYRLIDHDHGPAVAFMEAVHAQPGEGVTSAGTFMRNVGHLEMALCCIGVRMERVSPQRWQKALSTPKLDPVGQRPERYNGEPTEVFKERKKAWGRQRAKNRTAKKNALKRIASERFPKVNMTLAVCDALLIADYGLTCKTGT